MIRNNNVYGLLLNTTYYCKSGEIKSGLTNVPADAYRATITQYFPLIGPSGTFGFDEMNMKGEQNYNFFVGECVHIKKAINMFTNDWDKKRLIEFEKHGVADIAITSTEPLDFYPLGFYDQVFNTNEEMANDILKIIETFDSLGKQSKRRQ